MSVSSSSPVKAKARCSHFGTCGGCALQDLDYAAQLERKTSRVAQALSFIKDLPELKAHGAPDLWFYRNKMEFSFGDVYPPVAGGPTVQLGLKPKGRWYEILDLQECYLMSPQTAPLLKAVRSWAEKNQVAPYNNHKQKGLLRFMVLREAKNGDDRMVQLVTADGELPEASFVEAVLSAYPATTILRGINGKISDTAVSERLKALTGPGEIIETLRLPGRELKFRISPLSFFQTNTRAAEVLYGAVRSWVKELKAPAVLDLYCGGGGIALSLADVCAKVVGVESNPSAVADASDNATRNGIANAEFYSGPVEVLLPSLIALAPQAAVVDPPRVGLHPKVAGVLAVSGPKALIYVSCNPDSLARDLKVLCGPYQVERVEVFDLFPHTEHVETAVLLRR